MIVIKAVDWTGLFISSMKMMTNYHNHLKREYPDRSEEAGCSVAKGNS